MECGSYLWKEAGKRLGLHFLRNSRDTEEEGVRGWVLILGKRAVSQLEMATIHYLSVTWWITETPPTPHPQSSARTESVGGNSFSGTPCMNVESWREEPGVYSSSTHQEQSYFQFLTRTLGHIVQLSPDESPSDWLNPWCGPLMCQLCPATEKNPESHHIHIKKKMLSNSCLFGFLFKLISICASFQILLHIIPQSPSIDCCSPWSTLHSGFGVLFLSEFALINNTFNQWRLVTSFCTPFHLNRGVTPYQNPWRQDLSSCTVVHFLSSGVFPAFDKLALHCTWEWEGVEWQWELKWKS